MVRDLQMQRQSTIVKENIQNKLIMDRLTEKSDSIRKWFDVLSKIEKIMHDLARRIQAVKVSLDNPEEGG